MASTYKVARFFYDVASPYSFLAFEYLSRAQLFFPHKIQLHLEPIFLGGIMKSTGNRPPASVPAKGKHLALDVKRESTFYNVEVF